MFGVCDSVYVASNEPCSYPEWWGEPVNFDKCYPFKYGKRRCSYFAADGRCAYKYPQPRERPPQADISVEGILDTFRDVWNIQDCSPNFLRGITRKFGKGEDTFRYLEKHCRRHVLCYAFPERFSLEPDEKTGDCSRPATASPANEYIQSQEMQHMPVRPTILDPDAEKSQKQTDAQKTDEEKKKSSEEELRARRVRTLIDQCDFLMMTSTGHNAQIQPRPVDFVLPGLVRGDIGAIIASGGTGKSFFGLQLSYSLACDLDIVGGYFGPLPRRRVLYVAREDQHSVLLERMYHLRARLCAEAQRRSFDESDFTFSDYFLAGDGNSCNPDDFKSYDLSPRLIQEIDSHFFMLAAAGNVSKAGASVSGVEVNLFDSVWTDVLKHYLLSYEIDLVIFDTLRMCHDGEENDGKQMSALINVMKHLAASCACSVIFLHHTNKLSVLDGKSSEVAQASRGSSVLVDNIRWQINLGGMSESLAEKYEETACKKKTPKIDRKYLTCVSCTKINNAKRFPDAVFGKDCYGALVRHYLTPYANGGIKGKVEKQNNKELIED